MGADSSRGRAGAGHAPTSQCTQWCVKLFPPRTSAQNLSHLFLHSLDSQCIWCTFVPAGVESVLPAPWCSPVHINCSKRVREMHESVKVSGAPEVSGGCLCLARLSLPRLPGVFPS